MPEQIPLMVDAVTQELRQFASDETIPRGQLLSALQVALTGLVTSDVSGVLASDTILQALGKLQAQASNKVDKVAGKSLSTEDYTSDEKAKLSDIASGATANSTDEDLRDRSTHTGTQPITTITGVVGTMAGGSIIERGSNANGEYVRFADGTQICYRRYQTPEISPGSQATFTLTYPAAFVGSVVGLTSISSGAPQLYPTGLNASNSNVFLYVSNQYSLTVTVTLYLMFIGAWK